MSNDKVQRGSEIVKMIEDIFSLCVLKDKIATERTVIKALDKWLGEQVVVSEDWLKSISEQLKNKEDEKYAKTGELNLTLHGAILGIGLVLGTHRIEDIFNDKTEEFIKLIPKSNGREGKLAKIKTLIENFPKSEDIKPAKAEITETKNNMNNLCEHINKCEVAREELRKAMEG